MNKIPYKVRLYLSIGLFLWAIIAFVISIIVYISTKQLWIIIVIPVIAVLSFIVSIIFFPRFKDDGSLTVEPKEKQHKYKKHKTKKDKKPFISDKEWNELDEEDEECLYISEDE